MIILSILTIKGKPYCGLCGMPILEDERWQYAHFNFHNRVEVDPDEIEEENGKSATAN